MCYESVGRRWYPSAGFHISKGDVGESESIQKKIASMISSRKSLSHRERFKKFNLLSLPRSRLRGELIIIYKYICWEEILGSRQFFN